MRGYLLDTHALVWWLADPDRLSEEARALIAAPSSAVSFSVAGVWELVVKGIQLPGPLTDVLRIDQIDLVSIELPHVMEVGALPPIHRDPFDRIMVAQARHEDLTLITRDARMHRYPVRCLAA